MAQGSVKQPTVTPQKKAKPQAKKSLPDSVDLSSDSDGYGYPDIEVRVPSPEEPSPIPPIRPIEPLDAARYDTIQAVWSPRNRRPNADKVKNALVAFKDVVKTVRDTWKENTQAMKTAENQGDNVQASQLKNAVVLQRHLMDVVVSTTLEMGHPMIVEKYVFFFFLIVSLASMAAFCHGHRIQKRIESSSTSNLPSGYSACLLKLASKGERLFLQSVGSTCLSFCPRS